MNIHKRYFFLLKGYKLPKQRIINKLLAQSKYDPRIYPNDNELEKIAPLFRRFCLQVKNVVLS